MRGGMVSIWLVLLSTSVIWAQAVISGKVVDNEGVSLPFATVAIYQYPDSALLVKADYSDENGVFNVQGLPEGNVYLKISSVGYAATKQRIRLDKGSNALGSFSLQIIGQELEAVVVSASKPLIEVHPDKMVFNIDKSTDAAGSNAWELLRKSPGVIIDNNDNLLLRGRSGVRIFINGRPSRLSLEDLQDYLASIPSSQIEAVELITNPPAKYEAEGNAGIINIRMKRSKEYGTIGTLTADGSFGVYPKYTGSVRLDHRDEKASYFANYSYSDGTWEHWMNFYRRQQDNELDIRSVFTSQRRSHQARAGADFFLGEKHTIGINIDGRLNDRSGDNESTTLIQVAGEQSPSLQLSAPNRSLQDIYQSTANANYIYRINKENQLSLDVNFSRYQSERDLLQPNLYFSFPDGQLLSENTFRNVMPSDINIYSGQVDWESALGKGKFTAGAKYVRVINDNTLNVYDVGLSEQQLYDLSNHFIYTEDVSAGYATYSQQLGDWGLQLGLRAEHTYSDGNLSVYDSLGTEQADQRNKRNYLDWFPNVGLSWKSSEKHQWGLSYSRRIDRPNYQALNPFEYRISELNFRKGNINLQPQYTHNVQLSHSFGYRLNTTVSYAFTSDFFAQVTSPVVGSDRASFVSTQNIASRRSWALNVSMPFRVMQGWNVFANTTLSHNQFKSDNAELFNPLNNTNLTVFLQNTFKLPWEIAFEVSGYYSSPSVWGGTFQTQPNGSLNLGLQRKFWSKRAQLKLGVTDLLRTQPWDAYSDYAGLITQGSGGWETRRFNVNLSYNFGNVSVKKRKTKSTIDDQNKRIGSE